MDRKVIQKWECSPFQLALSAFKGTEQAGSSKIEKHCWSANVSFYHVL